MFIIYNIFVYDFYMRIFFISSTFGHKT